MGFNRVVIKLKGEDARTWLRRSDATGWLGQGLILVVDQAFVTVNDGEGRSWSFAVDRVESIESEERGVE